MSAMGCFSQTRSHSAGCLCWARRSWYLSLAVWPSLCIVGPLHNMSICPQPTGLSWDLPGHTNEATTMRPCGSHHDARGSYDTGPRLVIMTAAFNRGPLLPVIDGASAASIMIGCCPKGPLAPSRPHVLGNTHCPLIHFQTRSSRPPLPLSEPSSLPSRLRRRKVRVGSN